MQFGVSESVMHWGKYRPNSIAVYCDKKQYTYKELNDSINEFCQTLYKAKITNNRVGLSIKNKYHLLIALISVLRIGKSNVFLNLGLTKESLKTNIIDTEISDLIYDSGCLEIAQLFDSESSQLINIGNYFENEFEVTREISFDSDSLPENEWGILFSSGTTGTPKGISRDHYSMVTEHLGWCLELGLNRNSKFYIGRPLFYTGGLVLALSTLLVGGSLIINNFMNDNDFEEIWEDFLLTINNLVKVEWAFFIPDQLRTFCRLAKTVKNLKTSENILVMGAPISGKEKITSYNSLHANIIESWGNSESLGTITDPEDLHKRPDSIGRPFLTDELYILDLDNNIIEEPNKIGRISGSIEAGFNEYTNRPKDTNNTIINDSIVSEDLGYYDDDGYFYIKSRLQDTIIMNGDTIFLTELENKIMSILDNHNICVSYTSNRNDDIKLYLVIEKKVLGEDFETEFLTKINSRIEGTYKIDEIFITDKLPRLSSGKVDKLAVKKIVNEQ